MKDSPAKLEGLVRSLNLIPYLHSHREATPMEIARDLGYSHEEVMRDLTRLSMSGVGSGPGELIDLVANWTGITVIDDQGLNKPLRLTPTEANALLLTRIARNHARPRRSGCRHLGGREAARGDKGPQCR